MLSGSDYVMEVTSLGQKACLNGFRAMDLPAKLSKAFIMGDVFLRKWVATFDMDSNRVGFALRKE